MGAAKNRGPREVRVAEGIAKREAAAKGRTVAGMGMCKFSDQEIRDIRASADTNVKLAADLGVSKVTISNIHTRKSYTHVT